MDSGYDTWHLASIGMYGQWFCSELGIWLALEGMDSGFALNLAFGLHCKVWTVVMILGICLALEGMDSGFALNLAFGLHWKV
jgi:hypothetical protein